MFNSIIALPFFLLSSEESRQLFIFGFFHFVYGNYVASTLLWTDYVNINYATFELWVS